MNILALDQSTIITGYALFNEENKQLIDHGIVKFSKNKNSDPIERILKLSNWFDEYLLNNEVDFVVMEDIQLQNEAKYKQEEKYIQTHEETSAVSIPTFKVLSKLMGVLEVSCVTYDIKYKIIKPTEWRHILNIKGNIREELKQKSIEYVKNNFNIELQIDEAEAVCIGSAYLKSKEIPTMSWGISIKEYTKG